MADLDDINNERDAMLLLIEELQKADDPEQFNQLLAMIQAQGKQLEAAAQAYADEINEKFNTPESQAAEAIDPKVEVVLTREQRQAVYEAHGIDMPSVVISDPVGMKTLGMPKTDPPVIEAEAMKSAEEFNRMVAAQAEAAAAVAAAVAAIEDADNPELQALLDEARKDPDFAGGMAGGDKG